MCPCWWHFCSWSYELDVLTTTERAATFRGVTSRLLVNPGLNSPPRLRMFIYCLLMTSAISPNEVIQVETSMFIAYSWWHLRYPQCHDLPHFWRFRHLDAPGWWRPAGAFQSRKILKSATSFAPLGRLGHGHWNVGRNANILVGQQMGRVKKSNTSDALANVMVIYL